MKIEKLKINGYDVFLYRTNKYSSIHMRFLFEMPFTRENVFKYDLLEEYQIHSSKKYTTRKELSDRRRELYSMNYGISNYNMGEKMFVEAEFYFCDPELVKDDYLAEAFEFARDILMYPNFKDGQLDHEELQRCKNNLANRQGDNLVNFRTRAARDFMNTLYRDTYVNLTHIDTREEFEDILDSYSDEDLIEAHEKLVGHSLVGLVIMGNIKDEYLDLIEKLFKFTEIKELDETYNERIPMVPDLKAFNHTVDEDYKESILRVVYEVPIENIKERCIYWAITKMIDNNGMLIHKTLRDERGIVYSAGAGLNWKLGYITMYAFIDAQNVDAALDGFDRVLEKLEDKHLREQLLDKVKEEVELAIYTFDESKWNPFYELYKTAFNFDISTEKRAQELYSITDEEIKEALKAMKKKTVHFYEGVKK